MYKISQTENCGYDTYDEAVVCAESANEAQNMLPNEDMNTYDIEEAWTSTEFVKVELIGESYINHKGVIVSSYRGG